MISHALLVAIVLSWPALASASIVVSGPDVDPLFCQPADVATARSAARTPQGSRAAFISATGRAMEVLGAAPWLPRIERLRICTDDDGLRAVARWKLPRLRSLDIVSLSGEPLGGDAVAALFANRSLCCLERLRFFGSDSEAERSIDGPGAFALAKARLPSLRILDLSWNAVPPDAIAALVSSRFAIELHELNLCRTSVAAQALIDANLTRLARLCISDRGGGASVDERARIATAYPGVLSPELDFLDAP